MKTMKVNPRINELITERVLAENEEREPSGRLSASRLGWPLQWQMLWHYKVPRNKVDEYTLRKFQRGHDVEERIMKWLAPNDNQMQVEVEYRGVVGVADVVLEYPIEVKSVTGRGFKYKQTEGMSYSHRLQAELYAKALGYDKFAVAYVASDDYRVLTFEEPVSNEVDRIIDQYEKQVAMGTVPLFASREPWQAIAAYNPYSEWQKLGTEGIAAKLAEHIKNTTH